MTTGDVLEMLDERVIHRSAAERADDREGLRGKLLRDYQSKRLRLVEWLAVSVTPLVS